MGGPALFKQGFALHGVRLLRPLSLLCLLRAARRQLANGAGEARDERRNCRDGRYADPQRQCSGVDAYGQAAGGLMPGQPQPAVHGREQGGEGCSRGA